MEDKKKPDSNDKKPIFIKSSIISESQESKDQASDPRQPAQYEVEIIDRRRRKREWTNIILAFSSIVSLIMIYFLSSSQNKLSRDALIRMDTSNAYTRQSMSFQMSAWEYQRKQDSANRIVQDAKDTSFALSQRKRDSLNLENSVVGSNLPWYKDGVYGIFSRQDSAAFFSGKKKIIFAGIISYRDVFMDRHLTWYCMIEDIKRKEFIEVEKYCGMR